LAPPVRQARERDVVLAAELLQALTTVFEQRKQSLLFFRAALAQGPRLALTRDGDRSGIIWQRTHDADTSFGKLRRSLPAVTGRGYSVPGETLSVFAPEFETRSEEAFVGYGGPLLGSIAALMVFCLYLAMPNSPAAPILLTGSFLGVFLNLFNLIPVSPLDGGRVMQSVSRFSRYIGILILGAVSLLLKTPVILMIWILLLSDMEILSRKLKAVLGSVFYVGMVSMMALGLSQQALWIDITDCVTAGIFTGGYIFAAFALKNHPIKEDQRALAAPEERLKWLGLYLGLASVLVIVIIVQQHYLQSMLVK